MSTDEASSKDGDGEQQPNPFQCEKCGKSFGTDRGRAIHDGTCENDAPWDCREVLARLWGMQNRSYQEVAEILGTTVDKIRYRVEKYGIQRDGSWKCPHSECDAIFGSEFALKVHYGQSEDHEGSIGGCSLECEWCGGEFSVEPRRKNEAKFCGMECLRASQKARWTTLKCELCGDDYRQRSYRQSRSRFCSVECKWKSRRAVSGQAHPSWRGGKSIYDAIKKLIRDESWGATASRIRERDGNKCRVCGKHTSEQDRALIANHIPALLDGGCNADGLLMAVCDGCHNKAEAYVRAIPEVELHLRDWSDDELPEGRERWTPDGTPTEIQPTLGSFAPADD